jgi:hypothetical protein
MVGDCEGNGTDGRNLPADLGPLCKRAGQSDRTFQAMRTDPRCSFRTTELKPFVSTHATSIQTASTLAKPGMCGAPSSPHFEVLIFGRRRRSPPYGALCDRPRGWDPSILASLGVARAAGGCSGVLLACKQIFKILLVFCGVEAGAKFFFGSR